jgi:hypothetical protein
MATMALGTVSGRFTATIYPCESHTNAESAETKEAGQHVQSKETQHSQYLHEFE